MGVMNGNTAIVW